MEQWLVHLLHAAAWTFVIIFLFAIIGVVATIRWIVSLFLKGEHAVEAGVQGVERAVTRK